MFDFNLRFSFGAYFLLTDLYVCLNVRFQFYDQSRVYVAITTIISRVYASPCATQPGESRCPISPRSCRRWKRFCHSSVLRRFSQSWLVSQFQRWEHYKDVDRWRCRCEYSSYRIRMAGCVYNLHRLWYLLEWQK